jgi:hypothetical protein
LDARSQELATVQKSVVDLRCQFDDERSAWNSEKIRLQAEIDEALKVRDAERIRAEGLAAEVRIIRKTSRVVNTAVPGE